MKTPTRTLGSTFPRSVILFCYIEYLGAFHFFLFFSIAASASKVLWTHCMRTRISACTAKKRFLCGPRDVDCDSLNAATVLSVPVAFPMLGSAWHSTDVMSPLLFAAKDTKRGETRQVLIRDAGETPSVHTPVRRSLCTRSFTSVLKFGTEVGGFFFM